MSLNEIRELPLTERIQMLEVLLDSFRYEEEDIPSPDWHKDVLSARMEQMAEGGVRSYSLDEIKARRS